MKFNKKKIYKRKNYLKNKKIKIQIIRVIKKKKNKQIFIFYYKTKKFI
jgi:hypothetical protein